MTAVGFEPTRIAPPELESGALDRSAKLSLIKLWDALLVVRCVDVSYFSRGVFMRRSTQRAANVA